MAADPVTTAHDADLDLYCIRCGYNLRGLSGDPRRCPECGHDNPVVELLVPAARIRAQLRRLESAPTWCFTAVLIAAVGVSLIVGGSSPRTPDSTMFFVGLVLTSIALIIWLVGAHVFGESCQWANGWLRCLLLFHAYATIVFTLGTSLILGSFAIPIMKYRGVMRGGGVGTFGLMLGWPVALLLLIWAYRRLRADLARMQREAAIAMYLEESRKRTVEALESPIKPR